MTLIPQPLGHAQAAGSGTDHGHLLAGSLGHDVLGVFIVPLHHEALQSADAHRLRTDAAGAVALALLLLGAKPGAELRQCGRRGDEFIGTLVVLFPDLLDKLRHRHSGRTFLGAPTGRTAQAAGCLKQGLLLGIGLLHLLEGGQPLRHGQALIFRAFPHHVGVFHRDKYSIIWHKHDSAPPYFSGFPSI